MVLFEHVSPISVCETLNINYDVVFFIGNKDNWNKITKDEYDTAVKNNKTVILGKNFNELILKIIKYLRNISIHPAQLSNFVIKIASNCNLNCSYCYMYKFFDNVKSSKNKILSIENFDKAIQRISSYSFDTNKKVTIGLHGGEPLLAGFHQLKKYIEIFNYYKDSNSLLELTIQTNGTLLNQKIIDLLIDNNVSIGISLDGLNEIDNSKRKYHSGDSSLNDTINSINILNNSNCNYGILSVLSNDFNFKNFIELAVKYKIFNYDFLLEDITYNNYTNKVNLFDLFKKWVYSDIEINIRYFKSLIAQACGYNWSVDTIGISPISTLVINTSGEYELLDTLRVVEADSWKIGLNVDSNILDVFQTDIFQKFLSNSYTYSEKCLSCKYFLSCGAGYIIHRHSKENQFLNPSIYCDELFNIFEFIHNEILPR